MTALNFHQFWWGGYFSLLIFHFTSEIVRLYIFVLVQWEYCFVCLYSDMPMVVEHFHIYWLRLLFLTGIFIVSCVSGMGML